MLPLSQPSKTLRNVSIYHLIQRQFCILTLDPSQKTLTIFMNSLLHLDLNQTYV